MSEQTDREGGVFKGERSIKALKCSKIATDFQKNYYKEIWERASQGEPVIWTEVGVPQEIMHAMDIPTFFNPNWSAIIAAKQMAEYYLNVLNEQGYFRDLCRYCSIPLGYFLHDNPDIAPWGGVPKPAAFVMWGGDDPVFKIWELMAKKLNVPLYTYDDTMIATLPKNNVWETVDQLDAYNWVEDWRIDYGVKQIEGLIRFLESVTGKTLSMRRLKEVMEKSDEQFDLIGKTMDLAARVPTPMRMGDHMANLISTQFFRGHDFGLAQAQRLYDEVKERVDKGIAAYDNEKVRLMFTGVPNWFTPGFYDSFEEEYGAVFAWMGYLTLVPKWLIRRDLSDPMRALSSRYMNYGAGLLPPFFPRSLVYEAKKFKVDGAVYEKVESCRFLSGALQLSVLDLERNGIPVCVHEADMVDVRDWDDAKHKAKMKTFIETVIERKTR